MVIQPSTQYSQNNYTLFIGYPATIPAPANSGGSISSFSISPVLPSGLTLDTAKGSISVTTGSASNTTYAITATGPGGSNNANILIKYGSTGASQALGQASLTTNASGVTSMLMNSPYNIIIDSSG
jgi:hypothetical protein